MASKNRRLPALERRAQLIEVGRGVFARHGYEGTSVEEIAKRAKVSKPIIYEHFGGKEGLYAVIVDREMEYVERRIVEAISSGSPRERVERASLAFLSYVRDHPDGFAVLSQDSPLTSSRGTMSSLLNDMAERVGDVFARDACSPGEFLVDADLELLGLQPPGILDPGNPGLRVQVVGHFVGHSIQRIHIRP